MADLKAGTTISGNTIWNQANLSLLPTGNTLTYKGFKVYTENDKPTKAEIGLGNVTNDAQVKKSGDVMTGDLTLTGNTSITVPRRVNIVSDNAFASYLMASRSDNNAVTDPFPSSETRVYSLLINTKSNTGDVAGGANLATQLFNQKSSGAGTMALQVFGPPNKTTGASGTLNSQITMSGEDGTITLSGTQLTTSMNTVVNASLIAQQLVIRSSGSKNLFFQDAGGNELGLIYADTGKNMYVRSGGQFVTRFASDGSVVLANALTVPGRATVNGQFFLAPDYDTWSANSALVRINTNGDSNAIGDGDTHIGYKDSAGEYNHYFRGKGKMQISTLKGVEIYSSINQFVNLGTNYAHAIMPPDGVAGDKLYLRKFRGASPDTIWHETVQGNLYRIATGSTDLQEEMQISQSGFARFRSEVQGGSAKDAGGQFRAVSGNYGFILRNDGATTYFMHTLSGDPYGGWSTNRPLAINNASGAITMTHGLTLAGGFNASGAAKFNTGLGIGTNNGLGDAAITIGDSDTGFVQEGDGILNAYSNAQRISAGLSDILRFINNYRYKVLTDLLCC